MCVEEGEADLEGGVRPAESFLDDVLEVDALIAVLEKNLKKKKE